MLLIFNCPVLLQRVRAIGQPGHLGPEGTLAEQGFFEPQAIAAGTSDPPALQRLKGPIV